MQVQLGNIGEIYKIRIGHDDNTEFAGWMCDKVSAGTILDDHTAYMQRLKQEGTLLQIPPKRKPQISYCKGPGERAVYHIIYSIVFRPLKIRSQ